MTKVYFAGKLSSINQTRVHTVLETNRKRTAQCVKGLAHHRPLAGKMEPLCNISAKTLDKFQRIVGLEILTTLWYYLRAQRCSPSNKQLGATTKPTDPLDISIEGQLLRCQLQYENIGTLNEHFAELPRRVYFAKIARLYQRDIDSKTSPALEEEAENK
jgi:hypothetical protein